MTPTQPDYKPSGNIWIEIARLLRWDKPEGRLILMIPALWAVVLASSGKPPAILVLVIIAGTIATSAAGCVVNDLWDRNIDPKVERTKSRPLAARTLTLRVGAMVAIVGFICAFGLSLYLNPLSFWLCVAAVPAIVLYPGAKRVFPVPQLVLSLAWGFAVLISWSAVTGNLTRGTWLLWGATVCWTLGFDTIYAMPDRPDDRRLGINSSALFFGRYVEKAIAVFLTATVALMTALGFVLQLRWGYWTALGVGALLWGREVLILQRSDRLPTPMYGKLFRENVWIGFILLAGMILGYRV
ncbi:4-hydroxybenzoate solanesyltransferase [Altericista sp. CCNU0014]|uniref:4-hydroxybenzoate solanesyltransferase n=1 Tax=Altericista sp. CCNU0014 TaxID=3082949 RepID=UPI00384C97C8